MKTWLNYIFENCRWQSRQRDINADHINHTKIYIRYLHSQCNDDDDDVDDVLNIFPAFWII